MRLIRNSNKGVSVIEIMVVMAILASALASLLGLINLSLGVSVLTRQTSQATALAQEAMEAARSIRDNAGWGKIANGSHGLAISGIGWDFAGTADAIDIFSRTVLIEDAQRDADDNIVLSGGTNDPNTKKITATVSWQEKGRSRDVKLSAYLTNWKQ